MTWFVVTCVVAGILTGLTGFSIGETLGTVIAVLLVLLVFVVGIALGVRGGVLADVRRQSGRLIAVPVASAIGSVAGCAAIALAWGHGPRIAAAMGSGLGWYTLSGPLLTHLVGPEAGAIAFLADVFRELLALMLIPAVARYIGTAEAVALGSSTSLGVTFPILSEVSGGEAVPLAISHGLILHLAAPLLIPFWLAV